MRDKIVSHFELPPDSDLPTFSESMSRFGLSPEEAMTGLFPEIPKWLEHCRGILHDHIMCIRFASQHTNTAHPTESDPISSDQAQYRITSCAIVIEQNETSRITLSEIESAMQRAPQPLKYCYTEFVRHDELF